MFVKFLIKAILVLLAVFTAVAQNNPSCVYFFTGNTEYSCNLTISNPNGLDNFNTISGQHIPGFGDFNVVFVRTTDQSITTNIPWIICNTFRGLRRFDASFSGVQEVGVNSFMNCPNLLTIELQGNRISRIAQDAFMTNVHVEWLDLQMNNISVLPENIFRPMPHLGAVALFANQIEVVHSNWFGFHHRVTTLGFASNRIHSIDRRIMQAFPNAVTFMMSQNICANGFFRDWMALQPCFDNFDIQTTTPAIPTTTPGQCVINDIFGEVCNIRDDMGAMENRIRILERIVAGKSEEINELKNEVKELKELVAKKFMD